MKFNWSQASLLAAFLSTVSCAAIPNNLPEPTPAASLLEEEEENLILQNKRDQYAIGQRVWTSTLSNGAIEIVTATVIDGVTISASPASKTDNSKPTPWVSLDNSGIPIAVTPSIVSPGGSTISASPTAPSSYPTPNAIPPVLRCFGDRVPAQNTNGGTSNPPGFPFCTPRNGTEMLVGETYWLTWDPTYWGSDDIKFVKLYARYLPSKSNEDEVFITDWLSNSDGYFPLRILDDYRIRGTNGYMFINMSPMVPSGSDAPRVGTVSGPIIRVISSIKDAQTTISRLPSDNRKNSNSSDGGLSKGQLAAAIVVPIIFVILMCALGYFWFLMRKRALLNKQTDNASKGKGVHIPKGAPLVATKSNVSTFSTDTNMTNPFHDRHESNHGGITEDVELSTRKPTQPTSAV